tara:strand:- start:8084 stop:8515 length:432 start_codon:yes stop_codon:yes gene_type:complete
MLIKSKKIGIPSLTPNKGVETDSNNQLATGEPGGGGGGGSSPVHLEFSITGDNTGTYHYEVFEHSKATEWVICQVFEWDNANSKRGDLVQCDIIPSNASEIPISDRTADTDNNVCVKIAKEAVRDMYSPGHPYVTQYYTVIVL